MYIFVLKKFRKIQKRVPNGCYYEFFLKNLCNLLDKGCYYVLQCGCKVTVVAALNHELMTYGTFQTQLFYCFTVAPKIFINRELVAAFGFLLWGRFYGFLLFPQLFPDPYGWVKGW